MIQFSLSINLPPQLSRRRRRKKERQKEKKERKEGRRDKERKRMVFTTDITHQRRDM